jgi:hypothetical protein
MYDMAQQTRKSQEVSQVRPIPAESNDTARSECGGATAEDTHIRGLPLERAIYLVEA